MEKNIYYKEISKYLKKNFLKNKCMNILELGCGNKIYKKDASNHQYEGLDLPDSIWLDSKNKPEILTKFSNFIPSKNYDIIFSVATIYLFDEIDIKNLVKLILNLKKNKGKIIIFDYKKNTINNLGSIQNNYQDILEKNFIENIKIINNEWCSNNKIKKKIKEIFKINKSHIIEISF